MDAISDYAVREVWVQKSAQIGWTEIINNAIGYHIAQDPATMLLIQPTLEMAEAWSKDRLGPMLRDTPALQGRVQEGRGRGATSTLLHKPFAGGALTVSGANSPASLASRPIRIILCDEVDRYPPTAGDEGDPIKLAQKRSATFWNRRFVAGSTPTVKGASRIEIGYAQSDQRRYYVPCIHCDEYQVLRWQQVRWDDGRPETAHYVCEHCGGVIRDAERLDMIRAGEWRATAPFAGIAGFHLWEAYSPWRSLADIVREFLASKDHPELLKVWVNTSLGEPWEDRQGEVLDANALASRRGVWDETSVPSDVICCTAGVDVQDDRLEATIVGWGEQQRAWVIAHHVLYGSPGQSDVWSALDRMLVETIPLEDGRKARVLAACIDSGGHHTQQVYGFAAGRIGRSVYAIKGQGGDRPAWPPRVSKSTTHRGGRSWVIGVDTIKDWLRGSLAVRDESLPHHIAFASNLDDTYFAQLLAEKRVTRYDRANRPTRQWVAQKGARNEALDCLVYAFAGLEALKVQRRLVLRKPAAAPAIAPALQQPRMAAPANATRPSKSKFASTDWMSRL